MTVSVFFCHTRHWNVHCTFLVLENKIGENSTMKKTNYLEIIGVLSLSFMLLGTYAVSGCLPEMMKTFHQYDQAAIDNLISVPSASILAMIVLSPILFRFLSERVMIISGLIIYGICGITPAFIQSYPIFLITRIGMGIGIGLVNANAVTMIGERFTGNLRARLLGIRCSMETLGQCSLLLIVAVILPHGWHYAFLIYGVTFIVLFIYLAFVPVRKTEEANTVESAAASKPAEKKKFSVSKQEVLVLIRSLSLGFVLISAASLYNMRLTNYVVDLGIGTSSDGSTILSLSIFCGFLAGLVFGKLLETMRRFVLPLTMAGIGLGMAMIGLSSNLIVIAACACLGNFFVTIGSSYLFNSVSEQISTENLSLGNAFALVGCNLGASTIAIILKGINLISTDIAASFLFYGAVFFGLCIIITGKTLLAKKQ